MSYTPLNKKDIVRINQEIGQSGNSYIKYEALLETTDNTKTPQLKSTTLAFEKQQYPETAEIETNDITAEATSWGNIITTQELNLQNLIY